MNHKYAIKHNKIILSVLIALSIIIVIGLVVNVISLVKYIQQELPIAFSVSMTVLMVIQLIVIAIFAFNCRYIITDKHFVFVFALLFKKVPITNVLLIREDKVNHTLLVYYKLIRKGEELVDYQMININPKHFDDFINSLKNINPNIPYENFDIYKPSEDTL